MADNPYLVGPGAGRAVQLHDLQVVHKVDGDQVGGALSIVEHVIQPLVLVKPHRHANEDEISIVLSGSIWARVGALEFEAPAGSYLVKPRGLPHAIWNLGPEPSKVAEIVCPSGFERYFDEIEPVLRGRGPEFDEQFYAIAQRYAIVPEDEWSTELQKKYGIHL
ncbi:MAG TPA: cupin domain-containing protein [Candidatus Limnocylindria bacterium]|nr:cupin domain-containing protein [Candidatus Limnocylindria bacterium]